MKLHDPGDWLQTDAVYEDDRLVLKRTQDVEPILEANKQSYDVDNRRFTGERFHKMASIPMVIVEQWLTEGIDVFKDEDLPKVRAKLNSSEYRYLRTRPGRM